MGDAARMSHLAVDQLKVGFAAHASNRQTLDLDHLHVDRGEAYGLVGESGSGKSVLALTVLRLLRTPPARIEAARLDLAGQDLLTLSEKEMRALRGREVAMVFQDPMSSLNPVFTVGTVMLHVIRRIHGERGKRATSRALEFINLVGLPDPESMLVKYPHQLSGGQRQRVIIALALCCDAKFLIADEPTRNLDVTVQAGVLKTIDRLRRELGVSLLFIANNLALVSAMCDRVGILVGGRIIETGSVHEVIGDARHPYTRMLMRVVPAAGERMEPSPPGSEGAPGGIPPTVSAAEAECPYYAGCAERIVDCEKCWSPQLVNIGGSHEVACLAATRQ